tara:strand:- start:41 stop:472 length:432 start_codon:yes stop_codon:yes gene_type:complete
VKSTDRRKGFRGYRLSDGEPDNTAGGASVAPLKTQGSPLDPDWMGLRWYRTDFSALQPSSVSANPGVYLIFNDETRETLYIGQTTNLLRRLATHRTKAWGCSASFLYTTMDGTLPHQLKELENDLIGAYFDQTGLVPEYQFRR